MPVFKPFGPDHWMVLGMTLLGAAFVVASAPRLRHATHDSLLRYGLTLLLVGNELGSWASALSKQRWGLPLQLCDLAVFLVAWALIGRQRLVGELAVCWGLAGSTQAVLTPDLREGFPSYPWWQFFLGHGAIVLGALYVLVRGRVRLTLSSVWRVFAVSNLYLVAAGMINWRLGTNFGYLARKPTHPSLLDVLGPWPYYILSIEVIALVLFLCCLGLSRLIDRWVGPARAV